VIGRYVLHPRIFYRAEDPRARVLRVTARRLDRHGLVGGGGFGDTVANLTLAAVFIAYGVFRLIQSAVVAGDAGWRTPWLALTGALSLIAGGVGIVVVEKGYSAPMPVVPRSRWTQSASRRGRRRSAAWSACRGNREGGRGRLSVA
jgi:hypothetical protein